MFKKRYTLILAGICILSGALIAYGMTRHTIVPELISDVYVNDTPAVTINGLYDHNNRQFNKDNLTGKWTFVFFGFTNCPDVCPATLTQLSVLDKKLAKTDLSSTETQFVLVSVDPERDTPEHLAGYMNYFSPDFLGITGKVDMIEQFERQFDAFHRYGKKNSNGFYTVQHSAEVFLINPSGKWVATFTPPFDLNLLINQFSFIVKRYSKSVV